MKTINTWLPIFTGFYNTLFEYNNETQLIEDYNSENGTDLSYDDFEWNYSTYHKEVAEKCTSVIEDLLKENNIVSSIKFEDIHSPRQYNFSNDSINVEITVDSKEVYKFVSEHLEEFESYIKEHFTSYSGFISFFSNNHLDWLQQIAKWEFEKDITQIGSILDFICETLINEETNQPTQDWLQEKVFDSECFEPEYSVK
jgi:hypothetical protein